MKNYLLILFLSNILLAFSQNPLLLVDIQFKDTATNYDFVIKEKLNDSLIRKVNSRENFALTQRYGFSGTIPAIEPGIYQFLLINSISGDTLDHDFFYLEKDFTYYIKYNGDEFVQSKSDLPKPAKLDSIRYKSNFGVMGSFFKNKWYNPASQVKGGYTFGVEWNNHYVVAKNVSLFFGFGLGYERYNLFKDSLITSIPMGTTKKQFYNNIVASGNIGVRFTSNNQYFTHDLDLFYVELGARYNLPIVFMHRIENDQHQALNTRRIHQYTDLRVYAAVGFSMVSLFVEYKFFDFVKQAYPEVGKFNIGIKLNMFLANDLDRSDRF